MDLRSLLSAVQAAEGDMSAVAYATATDKAQLVLDTQACGGRCACEQSRRKGKGNTHCLNHNDSDPSMSVTPRAGDEAPLLYCHAGCDQANLFAAFRELDDGWTPGSDGKVIHPVIVHPVKSRGPADHRYQYFDGDGQLIATKLRWDATKAFEWEPSGLVATDLLYGRELLPLHPDVAVLIVEGEKCAEAARAAGIRCAISGAAGASGTPSREALAGLSGRKVVLFPDKDEAGVRHMAAVAANLPDTCDVSLVEWPDSPAKGDVVDFLAAHPGDDLALKRLLTAAKPYEMPAAPVVRVAPPALTAAERQLAASADFGFISDFATYVGHRLDSPPSEHLLLGCVCVAAAVGPHLVSEMRWSSVQANIWSLQIGASGASKTTRGKLPASLVYEALPDRALPGSSTPESLIELMRDLTPEQAADREAKGIPAYRGAGVTFKDEYSALLRQIQNPGYMAGAGESLIGLYDGTPISISTKAGGLVRVTQPCLSMLASITPRMFATVVKPGLVGGGYLARHIHVLVPKRPTGTSSMADDQVVDGRAPLRLDLVKLRQRADRAWTLAAHWPDELLRRWDEYRGFLDVELAAEERSDELEPYYQRYPEHVMKLAMLLAYTEAVKAGTCGDKSVIVTESALVAAIQIVEASRVAVRVAVASLSDSQPIREAQRVAKWLEARGGQAAGREVYRAMNWSADDARKYRQTAEAHGLVVTGGTDWILVPE